MSECLDHTSEFESDPKIQPQATALKKNVILPDQEEIGENCSRGRRELQDRKARSLSLSSKLEKKIFSQSKSALVFSTLRRTIKILNISTRTEKSENKKKHSGSEFFPRPEPSVYVAGSSGFPAIRVPRSKIPRCKSMGSTSND